MSVLATDTFTGADLDPLPAPPWVTVTAEGNFKRISNAATPTSLASDSAARNTSVAWPADQYSQAQVTVNGTGAAIGLGVSVRMSGVADTHYRLVVNSGATNNVELASLVAGAYTMLQRNTATFNNGDTLRLEVHGSTLRGFINGVQVGTDVTDGSITGGDAGISYSSSLNSGSLDNWEGGDFVTSGGAQGRPDMPTDLMLQLAAFIESQRRISDDVAAAASTTAPAQAATMTIVAQNAQASVTPVSQAAALSITSQTPAAQVTPASQAATLTIVAQTPAASVQPASQAAAIVWAGQNAGGGATPGGVQSAPINWQAQSAVVATAVVASAGVATIGWAANGAAAQVAPGAGAGTIGLAAQSAQDLVTPGAQSASIGLAAGGASGGVGGGAGSGGVGMAGQGASALVAPAPGAAPINWLARDAVVVTSSPGTAAAQAATLGVAAQAAAASVAPPAGAAALTWLGANLTTSVVAGVGFAFLGVGAPNAHVTTVETGGITVSGGTTLLGLCEAWTPQWSCALPTGAGAVTGVAAQAATEVLWSLSGRQYGFCTLTLRPCRPDCAVDNWGLWWNVGANVGGPQPVWFNGAWFNIVCGGCGDTCSCTIVDRVMLPGPVGTLTEVKVDGVALVPGVDYRLDNGRELVRLGGKLWPICNDLSRADTQPNTWSVTASFGLEVPALGQIAVGVLATEFVKLLLCDTSCALPKPVQSLQRQGISITFLDPNVVFADGKTGLYMPDLFISTVNPGGTKQRSRIYDVDHYPGNYGYRAGS